MDQIHVDKSTPYDKLRSEALELLIRNYELMSYHNIGFSKRILENIDIIADAEGLSTEDRNHLKTALWFYVILNCRLSYNAVTHEEFNERYTELLQKELMETFTRLGFTTEEQERVANITSYSTDCTSNENLLCTIFMDSLILDLVEKNGKNRLRKFYQEAVLNGLDMERHAFYAEVRKILMQYKPKTEFAKIKVHPQIIGLLTDIEKEQKKVRRIKDIGLQREMGIDSLELKKTKKKLQAAQGRDDRGIQTLFRTTSHNHYTLNEMVDRKANIMITVNSIILSMMIGGFLQFDFMTSSPALSASTMVLSVASLLSIIFAIISILPNRTQGNYTRKENLSKDGNLLYFGNFYKMPLEDFEEAMMEKTKDSDYLYRSMIRDLYYLGQKLHKKYRFIRISLWLFLSGVVLASIISLGYNP